MKRSLLIIPLTLITAASFAQDEYDALRFSQTYQQGTARSAAMGGAFGALGGDLSCLSTNPAGIAIYKKGEMTITPLVSNLSSETTAMDGSIGNDDRFSFKIANFGVVSAKYDDNSNGFKGFAWGISYNRLMDFNGNERFFSRTNTSSILDAWRDNAEGIYHDELDQFREYAGYDTYLLNDDNPNSYNTPYDKGWRNIGSGTNKRAEQKRTLTNKGGINVWDFAISGNYNDKVYFGASLGIQTIRFKSTSIYSEDDRNNIVPFENFDYKTCIEDDGTGVNLKAGVIVKPVNFLRFGAAIHTPTWYSINDKYYTTCEARYDIELEDGKTKFGNESDKNSFNFKLNTPFKGILSAAFVVPNIGLLSLEYEYVDYTKIKYVAEDFDSESFDDQNQAIKEKFQKTQNVRLGAEVKLTPNIALRGGYAIYGNPCKEWQNDIQRQVASLGIGIGDQNYFVDLTATYHIYNNKNQMLYCSNDKQYVQTFNLDNRYLYILATVGLRF